MESAEDLEAKIKTIDGIKESSFKDNPSGPTGEEQALVLFDWRISKMAKPWAS